MSSKGTDEVLIDVTRLIWRVWRGRHPTGIDRVCRAYVEHFQDRALAVVQRKGLVLVLSKQASRSLFSLLLTRRRASRAAIIRTVGQGLVSGRPSPPRPGMLYLNVGHTGLNDRALPAWLGRHQARAIYLVHDLIPITNPEYCRPGEARKHRERMANALQSATGIIGNSQATLDELAAFANAISVSMPSSIAAWIAGFEPASQIHPKSLSRPFFVTLGTIEARKNHLMLLELWQGLVAAEGDLAPILVVIGQPGWEAERALAIVGDPGELAGSVIQMDDCGDAELAAWIAGARALLMPSFAEGFGLPIIESLSLGTPVIVSDLPVFREIAGDIPTYLRPDDDAGWETKAKAFTGSDEDRDRQLRLIAGYRPPSWPDHFRIVETWLAQL